MESLKYTARHNYSRGMVLLQLHSNIVVNHFHSLSLFLVAYMNRLVGFELPVKD